MGWWRQAWVSVQVTPPLEHYRVHPVTLRDPSSLKGDTKKKSILLSVDLKGFCRCNIFDIGYSLKVWGAAYCMCLEGFVPQVAVWIPPPWAT